MPASSTTPQLTLFVCSDLHLNLLSPHQLEALTLPAADAYLIAGDTMDGVDPQLCNWVVENTRNQPTFLIPGNHDLHGFTRHGAVSALEKAFSHSRVTVLMDSYAEIAPGLAVYGSDYWTDLKLTHNPEQVSQTLRESWDDFKKIKTDSDGGERSITPEDTVAWHRRAKQKLAEFAEGYQGRYILMTHHGAFKEILPLNHRNEHSFNELDAAYTSDGRHFIHSNSKRYISITNSHQL